MAHRRPSSAQLCSCVLAACFLVVTAVPARSAPLEQTAADPSPATEASDAPPDRGATGATPPLAGSSEVVVTAARVDIPLAENPAATSVVGADEVAAAPRAVAADEVLKLVPGVKVDNQHNGERVHLSIRGQGLLTERGIRGVKVLLDGLPLNDPTGFAPDLYDVDWATVERIEASWG